MGLNIKNPEVERLASEVAKLAGESKTEAIRRALIDRKHRLDPASVRQERSAAMRYLEEVVWKGAAQSPITRAEREELLGLGEDGLPTQ